MKQDTPDCQKEEPSRGETENVNYHDLRNVISVAMLAAEMMKRHRHNEDAFSEAHQQLKDELKKASRMITALNERP